MVDYLSQQSRESLRKAKEDLETVVARLDREIGELDKKLASLIDQSAKYKSALSSLMLLLGEPDDKLGLGEELSNVMVDAVGQVAASRMTSNQPDTSLIGQVVDILRRYPDGLHYKQIYNILHSTGVRVPGQNPELNLSTHMSRSDRLVRVGRGIYRLKPL